MSEERTGAEFLRWLVGNLGDVSETFNDRYSVEQLIAIGRAWEKSEWDFYPDQWEERQVREALEGVVPTWSDDEVATYKTNGVEAGDSVDEEPPMKPQWRDGVRIYE